ncbi:MAG: chemotaxis protein CheW [Nitrospirota bacterium]
MAGRLATLHVRRKLLCLEIGERPYVTEIERIREIVFYREPVPVPHAPAFLDGLMDLRGTTLPLIELRERFGVPASARTRPAHILIVRLGERLLGLVVDRVSDVLDVDADDFEARKSDADGGTMCRGVCRVKDALLLVVDLDAVLGPAEFAVLSEVA